MFRLGSRSWIGSANTYNQFNIIRCCWVFADGERICSKNIACFFFVKSRDKIKQEKIDFELTLIRDCNIWEAKYNFAQYNKKNVILQRCCLRWCTFGGVAKDFKRWTHKLLVTMFGGWRSCFVFEFREQIFFQSLCVGCLFVDVVVVMFDWCSKIYLLRKLDRLGYIYNWYLLLLV